MNGVKYEYRLLWVEEYRPKTIDDCILPTSLKTLFKSFIKKGELSNLLFSGTLGIGKDHSCESIM